MAVFRSRTVANKQHGSEYRVRLSEYSLTVLVWVAFCIWIRTILRSIPFNWFPALPSPFSSTQPVHTRAPCQAKPNLF